MIKAISSISMLAAIGFAVAAPASALSAAEIRQCKAMGASLTVRKQEINADIKARGTLFEQVELAGDEWEAAEAMRNFGATQAEEADQLQARYEDLKGQLARKDMALSSNVSMVNSDTSAYAAMCGG